MGIAHEIFSFVFKALGIDKKWAKELMKDPVIKREVEKTQKAMLGMEKIIKDREELQRKRGQIE